MKTDNTLNKQEGSDMDWALFNLFEGDLTDQEANELLEEIESNDALRIEWEMIRQTKIQATPITYNNKSSLLKKEENVILMVSWWIQPLKIAASVALLCLLAIPLYQFIKTDISVSEGVVSNLEEVDKSSYPETPANTDIAVKSEVQELKRIEFQEQLVESYPAKLTETKVLEKETDDPTSTKNYIDETIPSNVVAAINTKTHGIEFVVSETQSTQNINDKRVENYPSNFQNQVKEYTGVRNAMNQGFASLIEPIRNSSIRIRKLGVKGEPGFKLEWTSDQYYAVAMVHLLPKKQ